MSADPDGARDDELDADALISDLDADQRTAVTVPSRLVAVIAGAGSGKTRVLTRRVAHRVATGDAAARHTLVLTFTREAAGELRRRLHRLGMREHIEAGTFHSVMLRVLKQRWSDTGRPPKTVQPDRRRILRDAMSETGSRAGYEPFMAEIDWATARGLDASAYAQAARRSGRKPPGGVEQAAGAFTAFERMKQKRGIIDFDDVLTDVLRDAEQDHAFGDLLRWRFRHLHVDEAQDLNPVQHRLVDLLRSGRDDLFLVGDPSQAIYGFNGADPRVLTEVESAFPGIEIVRLPVNHRCTPQIVRAGMHVLDAGGAPVDLRSARLDGPMPIVVTADDEAGEAAAIARRIVRSDPNLVRAGEVAVLARTNRQLGAFETALAEVGLPVRRRANAKGTPLQVAVQRASAHSSPSALRAWAHDVLDDIDALTTAKALVESVGQTSRRPNPASVADARHALETVEAERRVASALLDFLRDQPRSDGAEFRAWVTMTNPFDDASTDGVELLTFHASKGREWHTVIVSGVETSLVPHKSATTSETRAEEARLLYVAVTRASDRLIISHAERRGGYARKISPLIADLDLAEPEAQPPPLELIRMARRDKPIERLREWRGQAAMRAGILPTQLCTDRDLSSIAQHRPGDAEELAAVTSMGAITASRLAPAILSALDAPARTETSTGRPRGDPSDSPRPETAEASSRIARR